MVLVNAFLVLMTTQSTLLNIILFNILYIISINCRVVFWDSLVSQVFYKINFLNHIKAFHNKQIVFLNSDFFSFL